MPKILFPYTVSAHDNEYVGRIIEIISQNKNNEVTASLEEFWKNEKHYDFIIINWPDSLLQWRKNLTQKDIDHYLENIQKWKNKGTKIYSIRHDIYPHTYRTEFRIKLYDISNETADGIIHLGKYSKEEYFERYSFAENQSHIIIPHPLYKTFNTKISKSLAKQKLGIKTDVFYIFVAGTITKQVDYDRAVSILNSMDSPNKQIGMNISNLFIRKPTRKELSKFIMFKAKQLYRKKFKNIETFHKFLPVDFLGLHLAAADLVVISRTDTLNSGNVFLASQFGKVIIGPDCGNSKEQLEYLDQIVYNSEKMNDDIFRNLNQEFAKRNNLQFAEETIKKIENYSNNQSIFDRFEKIFTS